MVLDGSELKFLVDSEKATVLLVKIWDTLHKANEVVAAGMEENNFLKFMTAFQSNETDQGSKARLSKVISAYLSLLYTAPPAVPSLNPYRPAPFWDLLSSLVSLILLLQVPSVSLRTRTWSPWQALRALYSAGHTGPCCKSIALSNEWRPSVKKLRSRPDIVTKVQLGLSRASAGPEVYYYGLPSQAAFRPELSTLPMPLKSPTSNCPTARII